MGTPSHGICYHTRHSLDLFVQLINRGFSAVLQSGQGLRHTEYAYYSQYV